MHKNDFKIATDFYTRCLMLRKLVYHLVKNSTGEEKSLKLLPREQDYSNHAIIVYCFL